MFFGKNSTGVDFLWDIGIQYQGTEPDGNHSVLWFE